jgi:hypothetical protein
MSAPKGAPFPHPSMFGLTMRFAAIRRVRRGAILAPRRNLSAKAMPPLWQYLLRLLKGPSISPSRGQPELATGRFPSRRAVTSEPV